MNIAEIVDQFRAWLKETFEDEMAIEAENEVVFRFEKDLTHAHRTILTACGGCVSCYGKGYSTQKVGDIDTITYCKCDRGNALEKAIVDSTEKSVKVDRDRIDKGITKQFKYASEHDNYDMRGADFTAIIHPKEK